MNVDEDIKASMKLFKMIFFLVIYIHFYACLWWLIIKDGRIWVPAGHMESDDFYQLYSEPISSQYIYCIFVAVQLLLGGDILPKSGLQIFYASLGVMFGAIINANIFGELVVIVESMGRAEKQFQSKFASMNTVMITLNLKEDTA